VADPGIALSVQRASKVLTFDPIIPEVTQRVLGLDDTTAEIVRRNVTRHTGGEQGFYPDIHDMVYNALGPGDALDQLLSSAAEEFSIEMQGYANILTGADGKDEELLKWIAHFVTTATARFLYGPNNPIDADPDLEQAFWDFDRGLLGLLVNILPSLTARKAWKGRENLASAFVTYLISNTHLQGSNQIIQRRCEIARKHGWSTGMIARSELSFLFAGISNTAITSFWMILHIVSRPNLLGEVLEELKQSLEHSKSDAEIGEISISKLKKHCSLFVSIYRETVRFGSENFSSRVVTTDTLLSGTFFLRKDAIVQISGGIIHADENIWGADVLEFNPCRFLPTAKTVVEGADKGEGATKPGPVHPAAFRPFGGGTTLCPGRHFATSEILGLVAVVLLTFDIRPVGGERIEVPSKKDNVLPIHILEPDRPVQVRITLRDNADVKWRLVL
jgi:cytochrome P450